MKFLRLLLSSSLLAVPGCSLDSSGGNLPLPRDMNLPPVASARPDPQPLQNLLPNGLMSYVVPDSRAPLVTLSAFVGAGTVDGTRQGAAESLLRDLKRGPGNLPSGEFQETLYRLAADFNVRMGPEETELTINVASEDAGEAIRLLAETVRRPAISAPVAVTTSNGEPGMEMAIARFRAAVLGGHPYGHVPTREDYGALRRNEVADYHQRYFVPSNTVLAVSGDFDRNLMLGLIQAHFGDWEGQARPEREELPPLEVAETKGVFTYPVRKLQGWVVMGHELPVIPEQDQAPLEVMNYILGGGHFDTRLFRVTRDRRGLTNDDSGFLEPSLHGPGTYSFRTSGRPQVVRLLIDLTEKEIQRMRSEPVTEQELFVAVGALVDGEFAIRFSDGPSTARSFAQEWLRFGNHSASASYPQRVRAVTAEDVLRVAREYLHPERLQIIVVGPIEQIEDSPAREGEGPLRSGE